MKQLPDVNQKSTTFLKLIFKSNLNYLKLEYEHRLGVSENKVLRKIFGHKRNKVTGEWRRLHNE